MTEFPDWLRGFVLVGKDGEDWVPLVVDEDGYMGAILKAAAEVTIPGNVAVDQNDSTRAVQGIEGANLRTIAVDASGQIIMVPRGSTGNYMSVDAAGFLSAILKGQIEGAGLSSVAVDASGQIIMVPRGSSGNYMSIDSDGYMGSVMKGIEGATLRTIAVDEDGNMISILKDTGDQWGEKISVGLGELAARLGSPISWDRRGQVVRIIDFSKGMAQMSMTKYGVGSAYALYGAIYESGGYSLGLTTGTNANGYCQAVSYFVYSPSERVGVEVAMSSGGRPEEIIIALYIFDGTTLHQPKLRFQASRGYLQYENTVPTYVDVCVATPPALVNFFFTVKFVIDMSLIKWDRVLYAGTAYDKSAYGYKTGASAVKPYGYVRVKALNSGAVTSTVYVDRIIVTTNEP